MITNEEVRKAIERYQKEHPLHFGQMIDVTAISSKEGADIISQTIEQVAKKVDEDTELWCICEMAKMYMQGVRPVYPVKQQGKWICKDKVDGHMFGYSCSNCRNPVWEITRFCPNCGAEMRGEE